MPIRFEFSDDLPTDGLRATLFDAGGSVLGSGAVAQREVRFEGVNPPADVALSLASTAGVVMRSGLLRFAPAPDEDPTWGDTFFLARPDTDPVVIDPARLARALPGVPLTTGADTITSVALTVGINRLDLTGTGIHTTTVFVGAFGIGVPVTVTTPFSFAYGFDLVPATSPVALEPVLLVRTLSASVVSSDGSPLAFLVDAIVNMLISGTGAVGAFVARVQAIIQAAVDAELAGAIGAQSVRPTSVSVESVTTDPTAGVSLRPIGCLSTRTLCATAASSGSVRLRPAEQLRLMRRLRDEVLSRSPQGLAYIETFDRHNRELAMLLVRNPDLLELADDVVAGVVKDFGGAKPGCGELSPGTAKKLRKAMDTVAKHASDELRFAIGSLRDDVETFVGRPAEDVLDESWRHARKG
ncbi:MAG TPA: hypothetical protein VHF89_14595 [Solirubrobacteraceae bacterium]|nr:hypothetical protein [Solirubrobacteraceae bacterium]